MQCHCQYQLEPIHSSWLSHTSEVVEDACHLRLQVPIILLLTLGAAALARGSSGRRSATPQRRELRLHTTARLSNVIANKSWHSPGGVAQAQMARGV